MKLTLKKFEESNVNEWDEFVMNASLNGTIFHTRNFLNYHPSDRFEDESVMILYKGKLAGVMAVAREGDGRFFSHPGTTGGGIVISDKIFSVKKLQYLLELIDQHFGLANLSMRIPENIFSMCSNDLWIYLLRQSHDLLPELALYKKLGQEDPVDSVTRSRTRSYIRNVVKDGFEILETTDSGLWKEYHGILTENLKKFDEEPTHTLEELLDLKKRLGDDSRLILGKMDDKVVGGIWAIRVRGDAWHTQYIAKDYTFDHNGIIPALLILGGDWLNREYNAQILNYGICTEKRGAILNAGLAEFKHSLGSNFINRYVAVPR